MQNDKQITFGIVPVKFNEIPVTEITGEPQSIPTPEDLLRDPCTPFWAQGLIRSLLTKDCCDVASVLEVLAQSFEARAKQILVGGR